MSEAARKAPEAAPDLCPRCGAVLEELDAADMNNHIFTRMVCPNCEYSEGPENNWGADE